MEMSKYQNLLIWKINIVNFQRKIIWSTWRFPLQKFINIMHAFYGSMEFWYWTCKRCIIHYATPDGRIIPFCSMNSIHREIIEKKFSKPLKKWYHGSKNTFKVAYNFNRFKWKNRKNWWWNWNYIEKPSIVIKGEPAERSKIEFSGKVYSEKNI